MGFPRQEYWSGCHFFLQGIFPIHRSNLRLLHLQAGSLPPSHLGIPILVTYGEIRVSTLGHSVLMKHEWRIFLLTCVWAILEYLMLLISLRALVHHHLFHHHFHGDAPGLGHSLPHISNLQEYNLRSSMSHHRKPNWASSLLHLLFLLTPRTPSSDLLVVTQTFLGFCVPPNNSDSSKLHLRDISSVQSHCCRLSSRSPSSR